MKKKTEKYFGCWRLKYY